MNRAPNSVSSDARLVEVLDVYLAAVEAGTAPSREALLAQHPELASELEACLASLEFIQRATVKPASVDAPAASPPASEVSAGVLGDFRIVREIGRGGMGVVYEAEQVSLQRRVALKVLPLAAALDSRRLQRFLNEARAAAGLHHTNIVPVYAVGSAAGVHFYAMQYIEGRTLASFIRHLRRETGLQAADELATTVGASEVVVARVVSGVDSPPTEPAAETVAKAGLSTESSIRDREYFRTVARLGVQAAEALEYAHDMGVIHRDIKPGNLLLDERGTVWITDFGLAQLRQAEGSVTQTGDLVGTLRYMSPEQAQAKRGILDQRTDVYALGATLYELLTLQPVFDCSSREEVLHQIAQQEPVPPRRHNRAVPVELQTIVLKALEKSPGDRYATAQALADDLGSWLDDRPIQARRPSLVRRARKWGRRHRPLLASVAVVFVALTAVLANMVWVAHDRAVRREAMVDAIGKAMRESAVRQQRGRLREALSVARRAEGLLGVADVSQALAQQVQARRADLELVDRLEQIRLESTGAVKDDHFDWETPDQLYAGTFHNAGLDIESLPSTEAAAQIRATSVPVELAAALDAWANIRLDSHPKHDAGWQKLLHVARLADGDAWRTRARLTLESKDRTALRQLAAPSNVAFMSRETLFVLGAAMLRDDPDPAGKWALAFLRAARQRHADDWGLNYLLWHYYSRVAHPPRPREALRFAAAGAALRPESPGLRVNLGISLWRTGHLDEAAAEFWQAIGLKNDYVDAHNGLGCVLHDQGQFDQAAAEYREAIRHGNAADVHRNLAITLHDQGRLDEAIAECRAAIRLKRSYYEAHCNLGAVLADERRFDEAIAEYRNAIRLRRDDFVPHNSLGGVLRRAGQLNLAIAEFREAIRLKQDSPFAHANLALALRDEGQFDGAIAEFREALRLKEDLHPAHDDLQETEAIARLDKHLGDFLAGRVRASDAHEQSRLAWLCQQPYKALYAASARWYRDAFTAQPKLTDDLDHEYRYNAACAAALAGCGKGKDAGKLTPSGRHRLRRQARDWLEADLAAYQQLFDKSAHKAGPAIARRLQHWLEDDDLAGVRNPQALAQLPEAEQRAWQKLWEEVRALRQRAVQRPTAANPAPHGGVGNRKK